MDPVARTDVLIFGGGVAGLWARAALAAAGYSVVLVEAAALGAGQTIASQGILHRGVKYALSPAASRAAAEARAAAELWDEALAGRGGIDLSGVRRRSESTALWSASTLLSRAAGSVAAGAMRSSARRLTVGDRPPAFALAPASVAVWEVAERVVDAASMLSALIAAGRGPVLAARPESIARAGDGWASVVAGHAERRAAISAGAFVLAAGGGNEALLSMAGVDPGPLAQRRPLHMAVGHHAPASLHGHCISELSDTPRLTITTTESSGRLVWSVGGALAESGVIRSATDQVRAAQAEVAACLPWLDLTGMAWSAHRIDRAERRTPTGKRPDSAVVAAAAPGLIAVWPTKLVLAPVAAQQVGFAVRDRTPSPGAHDLAGLEGWPRPAVADPPWARSVEPAGDTGQQPRPALRPTSRSVP